MFEPRQFPPLPWQPDAPSEAALAQLERVERHLALLDREIDAAERRLNQGGWFSGQACALGLVAGLLLLVLL